jgi:hypothetical protein
MAIEAVKQRLRRATAALNAADVSYAVLGGNAVAEWVGRVDPAAVRFTQDVDLLLRRDDLPAAIAAMETAGFTYRHAGGIDFFLDGPDAKFRDAVHIVFAGEKVRDEYVEPAADVAESVDALGFRVLSLEALVRMKLTSFRDKDRTHLRDLIDVELIDASWTQQFTVELASRLQQLLDDPDG